MMRWPVALLLAGTALSACGSDPYRNLYEGIKNKTMPSARRKSGS